MSKKINWGLHLIELVIVTLGILIGFGLNSWNETRKDQNLADLYLNNIKQELLENKKVLQESYAYHSDLLEQLNKAPLEAQLTLSPGEINNSAWRLSENLIFKKHIAPKIYRVLSAVYKTHDYLVDESTHATQLMNESNVLGGFYLSPTLRMNLTDAEQKEVSIQLRQGWIPIFETWTSTEEIYLQRIDEALKLLN
ncbi:MAG: DUF6090 family protein [Bacteroidota bacterium]